MPAFWELCSWVVHRDEGVGVSRGLLRGPQGPGLGRLSRSPPWWLFWNSPHLVDPTSPMKELGGASIA